MGQIKPFGLALGLLANAMIAVALHKLIGIGSCGDVYQAPCPDGSAAFVLLLVAGIFISILGIFLGGGSIVFLGVFLAVGVGSITAGLGSETAGIRSFALPFGGMFIAVPLALAIGFALLTRSGGEKAQRAQNLVLTGAKGVGTVVSLTDTGLTINDNPRVRITMRVEPEDLTPAFDVTKAVVVSRIAIPRAGDRFPVWYDRNDPTQWVYGTDLDPGRATPEVQALFARAGAVSS